jgi:uncharacterized cupredoxin-like copper-binding protein
LLVILISEEPGPERRVGARQELDRLRVIGQPGDPSQVSRTITMTMSDAMRFTPDRIEVRKGETIRFVLQNEGQLRHELVLGEPEALRRHAA